MRVLVPVPVALFSIGPNEMLILLIFAILLIFGPSKIPELAKSIGLAVREFKKAAEGEYVEEVEVKKASSSSVSEEELKALAKKLGISTEGKSAEELKKEIIEVAKKEGLLGGEEKKA